MLLKLKIWIAYPPVTHKCLVFVHGHCIFICTWSTQEEWCSVSCSQIHARSLHGIARHGHILSFCIASSFSFKRMTGPVTGKIILCICEGTVFLEPLYYMENSHKGVGNFNSWWQGWLQLPVKRSALIRVASEPEKNTLLIWFTYEVLPRIETLNISIKIQQINLITMCNWIITRWVNFP